MGSTYSCANLHKVFSNWRTVIHGIKGGDFINPHRRHLKNAGNLVHDTYTGPAMLSLAEIKKGHYSCLLILGGIPLENFIDQSKVLFIEFERNVGIVVWCVSMLECVVSRSVQGSSGLPADLPMAISLPQYWRQRFWVNRKRHVRLGDAIA